jgi:hypothetical protein
MRQRVGGDREEELTMPKAPALFMESTEIAPTRSAAEVSACLIQAGATQIATDYEAGKVSGLRWAMRFNGRDVLFVMPTRIEPVYQLLLKRRTTFVDSNDKIRLREKAERVAWRQLLRWVQAQCAMIDCGMVKPAEVFMPYIEYAPGKTMFEALEAGQQALGLPPGRPQ